MSNDLSSPDYLSDDDLFAEARGAPVGTLDDIRTGNDERDWGIDHDPEGELQVAVIEQGQEELLRQAREALKDPRE